MSMDVQKETNFVSAVVYVRNNENTIGKFLGILEDVLSAAFMNFEIICVNDASRDSTKEELRKYCKQRRTRTMTIVNLSMNHGLEAAMVAGVELAIGDYVYEFDTISVDYDPDLIIQIYRHLQKGFDIVRASPQRRLKLSSRIFYRVFNRYASTMYPLTTESFRLITRRAVNRVRSLNTTLRYRKAHYANCGLKMDIVRYAQCAAYGASGSFPAEENRKGTAFDTLILYTSIAQKLSIGITFTMMFFSVFMGTYTLIVFLSRQPVEGWTTTMLFVSIGFFGIFGIMSIMIKYLSIIVDLVFKERNYLIESVEKISE